MKNKKITPGFTRHNKDVSPHTDTGFTQKAGPTIENDVATWHGIGGD